MPSKKSFLTVTDQFCGAGGSSLGAHQLGLEVYLAMNHWPLAIETHNTNFPDTLHDCADVSASDPRRYPSTDILITSPECTNHSVAKGVRRRQKQMNLFEKPQLDPSAERSRATMWDVPRFAEYHDYRVIVTENVVDARHWIMWDAWIHAMDSLGYEHHVVYLNSMFAHLDPTAVTSLHDFAPQSRDRMYVVFWKRGNKKPDLDFRPTAYCPRCETGVAARQAWKDTPAVRRSGGRWGRYGAQYIYACGSCGTEVIPYHFAAANAIDWTVEAERIGDRKRPLRKKTLERIQRGLDQFAGEGWLVDTTFSSGDRVSALTDVSPTQTTRQSFALAFLSVQYSPGYNKPITDPLAAVTTQDHHGLVTAPFLTSTNYFDDRNISANGPMGTQTTQTKWGVTLPPYVVTMRGTTSGMNAPKGVDEPLDTFSAGGFHHGLVTPPFMMSYYGSGPSYRGLDEAMGTVMTKDRHALVEPGEKPAVEDCRFRMLEPHEIGRGMAFPEQYVVKGNKRERVKQYGNAVTPPAMKTILARCVASLS